MCFTGKTISEEVQKIMAPYGQPALTNVRGTKRQAKKASFYGGAFKKGKHRQVSPKHVCFQKKLIVIRYMGKNAPKQFTLKESIVALRGLLPEIDVQASELDVRAEIAGLIADSGEMAYCTRYSFEFIEANGKNLCVPAQPKFFEWSGKAVKHLAGNGQVYVRMLTDPDLKSSSDEDDMPAVFHQSSPDVAIVKVESSPNDSQLALTSDASQMPLELEGNEKTSFQETTQHNSVQLPTLRSETAPPSESQCSATTQPPLITSDVTLQCPQEQFTQIFPHVSQDCLSYVLKLSSNDLLRASDCILSGPSIESLVSLLHDCVITSESESLKLRIDDEEEGEDLVESIFAFYKGPKFNCHCTLRVVLKGQPAIDTGGVRRQILSEVLKTVTFSTRLGLFEGPQDRRRPTFRISSLSSGVMKLLGRIIGHSIILDCQGFPYLSPACYSYMVGNFDQALLLCTPEDASERVQHTLKEVSKSISACI